MALIVNGLYYLHGVAERRQHADDLTQGETVGVQSPAYPDRFVLGVLLRGFHGFGFDGYSMWSANSEIIARITLFRSSRGMAERKFSVVLLISWHALLISASRSYT